MEVQSLTSQIFCIKNYKNFAVYLALRQRRALSAHCNYDFPAQTWGQIKFHFHCSLFVFDHFATFSVSLLEGCH